MDITDRQDLPKSAQDRLFAALHVADGGPSTSSTQQSVGLLRTESGGISTELPVSVLDRQLASLHINDGGPSTSRDLASTDQAVGPLMVDTGGISTELPVSVLDRQLASLHINDGDQALGPLMVDIGGIRTDVYDLASHPPRDNLVIIFNHYKYKDGCQSTREGTHEDMNRLCEFFNYLQYTVFAYQDLTYDEIMTRLRHHSSPDHAPSGSLTVVVMTHGGKDGLLWAHDRDYKAHDIWEPFIDCVSLKGKPKFFIFQACRWSRDELGTTTDAGLELECLRLPHVTTNVLLAFSTVEDRTSQRDELRGSPFIQALCDELWNWPGGTVDLITVLTRVIRVVYEEVCLRSLGQRQTPTFVSFLDRLIINTQSLPLSAQVRQHEALLGGGPSTSSNNVTIPRGLQRMGGVSTKEEQYSMAQGVCALIYSDLSHREQSRALRKVLLECNFSVNTHDVSFIDDIKEDAMNDMNLKERSCLLVFFLAPLNEELSALTSQFAASNCPELAHKPKIFISVDQQGKICCKSERTLTRNSVDDHSDFLIVQGAGEDFITEFIPELQFCVRNQVSLIQILTEVFGKTIRQHGQQNINMESTLRRDVVFGSSGRQVGVQKHSTTEMRVNKQRRTKMNSRAALRKKRSAYYVKNMPEQSNNFSFGWFTKSIVEDAAQIREAAVKFEEKKSQQPLQGIGCSTGSWQH